MNRPEPQSSPDSRTDGPATNDSTGDEPIFRAILWVMVISVVAGVGLALAGELVFVSESIRNAGTGVGIVSGMIYFIFRWLGRREAVRRPRVGN